MGKERVKKKKGREREGERGDDRESMREEGKRGKKVRRQDGRKGKKKRRWEVEIEETEGIDK